MRRERGSVSRNASALPQRLPLAPDARKALGAPAFPNRVPSGGMGSRMLPAGGPGQVFLLSLTVLLRFQEPHTGLHRPDATAGR